MGRLNEVSPVLRREETGNAYAVYCPGCGCTHLIPVAAPYKERWTFNGDVDHPVFQPSLLVRTVRIPKGMDAEYDSAAAGGTEALLSHPVFGWRCHSFIGGAGGSKPGFIEFLSDCSHELAGKTVPLMTWAERDERMRQRLRQVARDNTPHLTHTAKLAARWRPAT